MAEAPRFFSSLLVLLPPTDISSILAALLLFAHAVLAAEAWKKPRLVTGAVSGIALGLLILTKAVFQYWLVGVTLAWATGLWWERSDTSASTILIHWGLAREAV